MEKFTFRKNGLMIGDYKIKRVIEVIIDTQMKYIQSGNPADLKRFTYRDIEERLCDSNGNKFIDVSNISRICNYCVVNIFNRNISLRSFFVSSGVGDANNYEIEEHIIKLIDEEDKCNPLTDDELKYELSVLGYEIARRTVSKYRLNNLGYPSSFKRRV